VCYALLWLFSCKVVILHCYYSHLSNNCGVALIRLAMIILLLACRYGTMRDNVISLKVVLPNGDVVKTASRARKSAAGFVFSLLLFSCSLFAFPFLSEI